MKINLNNRFVESMKGKIIIAFILILSSLLFIWFVNRIAFKKITTIVNELAQPNQALMLSRKLFIDVSNLTHLQRSEVMEEKSKPSDLFFSESKRIAKSIDSLKYFLSGEPGQVKRIDSIHGLMNLGNKLFLEHLKLRFGLTHKKEFETQINALSQKMDSEQVVVNKNVTTTEKKVTIKTVLPADPAVQPQEKKSWLKKLFSKKKKDSANAAAAQPRVTIEEQTNTTVDTVSVANHDTALAKIGSSLKKIERTRLKKNDLLKKSEQKLLQSNEALLNQLINILSEVEKAENMAVQKKTGNTVLLADNTINLTKIITILLIVTAVILGIFILADITRSRKYRKQLEVAKSEAEYHSVAKQRFLANMSHEIRTPLQSILGFSELELLKENHQSKYIDAIHKSAKHLLQIVNEVLDYSRITSGKFTFENKIFCVADVVTEVIAAMEPEAAKKLISLKLVTPGFSANQMVAGDAFRLKQVLFNLIGNAIKFTREGNIEISVHQNEVLKKVAYKIVVADTGIGMEPAFLTTIFNQFEQAEDNPALQNGTGLGLSIVKELVEAQEGTIAVASIPGKGSVFTVTIVYDAAAQVPQNSSVKLHKSPQLNTKVWLVDDDPLIRQLTRVIFKQNNIGFELFESAENLLEAQWTDEVKIVITDIRLPGMSGAQLCKKLKTLHNGLTIIALTAQVLPEQKESLIQMGFDAFLLKPFSAADITGILFNGFVEKGSSSTFNLGQLTEMIDNKEEVQSILKQCHADTTKDIEELTSSSHAFNIEKSGFIVHRLAGRVGQIGDKTLAAQLRKSEAFIRNIQNREELQQETASIQPAIHSFLFALEQELGQ